MTFTNAANRVPFVQIANDMLRNPALSLKAKGLLALMLTYREGWQYHMTHLETLSTDGPDSLQTGIAELLAIGYVTRRPYYDHGIKRLNGYTYTVSDSILQATGFTGSLESSQPEKQLGWKSKTKKTNPKKTNPKKTKKEEEKEEDTSAHADHPDQTIATSSQEGQEGHGKALTLQPPSEILPGHARASTAPSTDTVAGAGRAKKPKTPWKADPAYLPLLDVYNTHRGTLPGADRMSKTREDALATLAADLGSIELAAIELAQATQAASVNKWWKTNRYGLDNLLRHVAQQAEVFRAAQADGMPLATIEPARAGRPQTPTEANEKLLGSTLDAMAYYNASRGNK